VSVLSVRQVGRIAVGALSFLSLVAACAEGTNTDDIPLGGVAGDMVTGGTDSGTAGSSSAGSAVTPSAGTANTATAGKGGMSGTAGTTAMAGQGGAGGAGGKAGSGSGGAGGAAGGMAGAGGKAGGGAGGAGGAAGMAGSAGSGGSGGAASTGHRYAKLVATSELGGNVWSSVAELQIMTTGNVAISRTGWTVTADSEETDDQVAPATAAIDGDNATFWHTAWEYAPDNVNDAPLPHSLVVDMKSAHTVTGFSYLPRQNNQNGRIKDWQFFVSKDGTSWGTAVKSGTFPTGTTLQTITF
jgi:hypothetical protein